MINDLAAHNLTDGWFMRYLRRWWAAVLGFAGLGLMDLAAACPRNTLYSGGDILTMEGMKPRYVETLLEREGRIVYVASERQALELAGAQPRFVDLKGATLLPGLIDAHGHFIVAMALGPERRGWLGPIGSVQRCGMPFTLHHSLCLSSGVDQLRRLSII